MNTEDRKFLDLDHVCDQILNPDDRAMFNEAVRCYQIGSHRAAIILAWCATADCLYRRIDELASEVDEEAKNARKVLKQQKGKVSYEETLITQAKKCELFDDYEEKSLRFARDTRSKCAHPTGVVPSAETVRHIFHTCSQTVLCRNGYRGMSFIKHFINTKLDDRHLFSDKNNVSDTCKYYFDKVPVRIRPQFASIFAERVSNGNVWDKCSLYWKANVLQFFRELMNNSSSDLAAKISQKFHSIESVDRLLFSVLVGLDNRENIWDDHTRNQAKAHLRDNLASGKVDQYVFQSYATLCSILEFEENDAQIFKERFSLFSKFISQHNLLQQNRRADLLSIIVDSIKDVEYRQQALVGVSYLVSTELFSEETDEIDQFVNVLIEGDWREDALSNLFLTCPDWHNPLKSSFLKRSREFLEACSEDYSEDVIILFDIADRLLYNNPMLVPPQFESTVKGLIEEDIKINWFEERGDTWRNFVGQVDLIKSRHGSQLTILSALSLPILEIEEFEE
jgi:hypothetical protein